jgi:uncharacterized membrane protein YfcA
MTAAALVLIGLAAGGVAATLGVGGGVIFVPALAIVAGFGQHLAEGTSLAVILPTTAIAAWIHARAGRIEWPIAVRVGAFGIVGGLIGAQLALSLDETLLRRLFAGLLIVVAVRMLNRTQRSAHG